MVKGQLPGKGPFQLGQVSLPAGKLIMGNIPGEPVAWATVDPVPGSSLICDALSELHSQTGLVPIQLDGLRVDSMFPSDRQGLPSDALRPWDNGEFSRPENPREADGLDVGALLEDLWNDWVSWPDEDDPDYTERRAPFTPKWPGLAAPEHTRRWPQPSGSMPWRSCCHGSGRNTGRHRQAVSA